MLSARTLVEDRIRGYDVGADQYLEKPFELELLLSMVRNLLVRRATRRGRRLSRTRAVCEFGRRADQFRHAPRRRSKARKSRLTHTEMKLLRYFVEHEGLVVTALAAAGARVGHEPLAHHAHGRQLHRQPAKVF